MDGVVGEVNFTTISFQVILGRSGPDVAVLVEVALHFSVDTRQHHVVADVELSLLVQQWALYVALDDVCFGTAIGVLFLFLDNVLNLFQSQAHLNAIASVGVFPRFDNPGVVLFAVLVALFLIVLLNLLAPLVVVFEELVPAVVFESVLNMESQRQVVKHVLPN